jgi:hypothetical protein
MKSHPFGHFDAIDLIVTWARCNARRRRSERFLRSKEIDVVADKGYFRTDDVVDFEKAGRTPHLPRP